MSSKIIYSFLPHSNNWKFWICLAFVIKCVGFFYNLFEFHNYLEAYHGSFLLTTGDTFSYFDPVDEFISQGAYLYDFRMPGYGFVYYILRLGLDPSNALNTIGFLQLIISSISVYALGLICLNLFKSQSAFLAGFFIYLLSVYTSIYDSYLLSESLCTSFLILSLYFFTKPQMKKSNLFFAGLFITWSIFMRPVVFPIILFMGVVLFIQTEGYSNKQKFATIICFLFMFFLVDGAWIVRNEMKYGKVIPFQKSTGYPNEEKTLRFICTNFLLAFEGCEPENDLKEFLANSVDENIKNKLFYPNNIYTSKFNSDSLINLQKVIEKLNAPLLSSSEKELMMTFLRERFFVYANSIKEEKPFVYYVESRLRACTHFLLQSGSTNLFNKPFSELNLVKKFVKFSYSIMYYSILIVGFIGLFYLLIKGVKRKEYFFILISLSGFYLTFVYPFVFKMQERRYFVTAYPLFVIAMVFTLLLLRKWIDRYFINRNSNNSFL